MLGIADMRQKKSIRLGRYATLLAILCLKNLLAPFDRLTSGTNRHQNASNIAHHMVQEGVAFDIHHNESAITTDIDELKEPEWAFRLAINGTKAGKILLAKQALRGFVHALGIQLFVAPAHAFGEIGRARGVVVNDVMITATARGKAGMKLGIYLTCPVHTDIARQVCVATKNPGSGNTTGCGIEVNDLMRRMHITIRAPSAHHFNRMIGHTGKRRLQHFLHGRQTAFLRLPAVILRAVVLQTECDAAHFFERTVARF